MMMYYIILIFIAKYTVNAVEILYENKFLFDNEKWQIIGNKIIEPAVHQSYSISQSFSHYIMFKDNLVNVDYKKPNDKSLWYFESPEIIINNFPIRESKKIKPKYPSLLLFTMTSFVGDFTNLNENIKLVKLRHGSDCLTFDAPTYDGQIKVFNVPFINKLWKHDITNLEVTDKEMKEMFIGSFTIEILGDWTRGVEVIGIDNIKIM